MHVCISCTSLVLHLLHHQWSNLMESISLRNAAPFSLRSTKSRGNHRLLSFPILQASHSHSVESRSQNKVFKELGLFALKRKIEDAVTRAEMIAPRALELEEARRIKQEEVLHELNLWDDLERSNESLAAAADAIKVVNGLKDLQYKAEEVKLITELAEMDVINHQLFRQAYEDSVDVSNFLDRYEMSKLLNGPYDKEGACMFIEAGPEGITSEKWAEKLLHMYLRWAEKHGCRGRVVEKYSSDGGGIKSVTIEFESQFFYGYLSGEEGTHRMLQNSLDGYIIREACSAAITVSPLFLERAVDLCIDDKDLEVSSEEEIIDGIESSVRVLHVPTGIMAKCSGERSYFANKIKALHRLKAKLLVISTGVQELNRIGVKQNADKQQLDKRKYMSRPHKMVEDIKTGVQLHDLSSVLDGNIEPLIRAHINLRNRSRME